MLPLHAHAVEGASGFNPEYLQRAMRFNLMDFEVALSRPRPRGQGSPAVCDRRHGSSRLWRPKAVS